MLEQVLIGVAGSIAATVLVLLTRILFYRIRDMLPARALFAGGDRKGDGLLYSCQTESMIMGGEYHAKDSEGVVRWRYLSRFKQGQRSAEGISQGG
jgi:hypothetical protein